MTTHPITRSVLIPLALACAGLVLRPDPTPPVPGKGLPAASAPAPMAAPLAAPRACPTVVVHFSPNGGCEEEVVGQIGSTTHQIRVQAYGFTSVPIADALISAHARGVDVAVILDRSNRTATNSQMGRVVAAGIPVYLDASHPIAHSKVIALDGSIVLTGSYNWTVQAERNAENLLTIRDAATARAYLANWVAHQTHSQPAGGDQR